MAENLNAVFIEGDRAGIEVGAGARTPERVLPDVERLPEAVDVLGDAELLDPRAGRRLQVAIDVLAREVALEGGVGVVGPQVQVVVGQHGDDDRTKRPPRAPRLRCA